MCADKKQEEEIKVRSVFLAVAPGKGTTILIAFDDEIAVVKDKDGKPHRFEYLVNARDWAVAELDIPPESSLLKDEEGWTRLREQAEADRRRKKHEDLPLFGHGKAN